MIFESTCRSIPTITKLKMQKMESTSHGIKMNMKTLPLTYALPMPLRSFDAAESFKEYDIKRSFNLKPSFATLKVSDPHRCWGQIATCCSCNPGVFHRVVEQRRPKRKRNRTNRMEHSKDRENEVSPPAQAPNL